MQTNLPASGVCTTLSIYLCSFMSCAGPGNKKKKKQLSLKWPHEKSKTKNKLQLVCVRQFEFPGVSPRFAGTLFFPLFLRLHGLLHQVTLLVKQATESPLEFRFPPLRSVWRKDPFFNNLQGLFFLSCQRHLFCVC